MSTTVLPKRTQLLILQGFWNGYTLFQLAEQVIERFPSFVTVNVPELTVFSRVGGNTRDTVMLLIEDWLDELGVLLDEPMAKSRVYTLRAQECHSPETYPVAPVQKRVRVRNCSSFADKNKTMNDSAPAARTRIHTLQRQEREREPGFETWPCLPAMGRTHQRNASPLAASHQPMPICSRRSKGWLHTSGLQRNGDNNDI